MQPRRSIPLCTLAALTAAWGGAGWGGCARTTVTKELDTASDAADMTRDIAYWHRLPERSAVSNNEGIHGLIILALDDDPTKTYDERVRFAKDKGLLPPGFNEPGNATMTRGTLAYALAKHAGVEGGVMMRISKGSSRYATRELVFLGILPEGSTENQSISGLDFVGVVSKAQDYIATRGTGFEPLQKDR